MNAHLIFLIPVYNEAPNIPQLADTLLNAAPGEKKAYVFVDDCSTDDTCSLLENYFPFDSLFILKKEQNAGPGDSFNKGFEFIIEKASCPDAIVITLEGDNTSDPSLIPVMLNLCRMGYPLVLASVYAQGGGFDKTNWLRRLVSFSANMLMRLAYDIKVLTLSSFYRAYSLSLLKSIQASYPCIIQNRGFTCMLEILVKAIRLGVPVVELPMVLHSSKRIGRSKMKIMKTTLQYLKFLLQSRKIKPEKR